jgi:hypothetical protein
MSVYGSLNVLSVVQITWHQMVGQRIWKEAIAASFEVLWLHVPEVTQEVQVAPILKR